MIKHNGSVHQIVEVHDNRQISTFLLAGKQSMLIDSGFAFTPSNVIEPYFRQHSLELDDLYWLTVTHASGDHCGGNAVLKQNNPHMTIVAHHNDANSISNIDTYRAEHVDILRTDQWFEQEFDVNGADFRHYWHDTIPVDVVIHGTTSIHIDSDWVVRLVHLPGHTPGHIGVFDLKHDTLYAGDALMGRGVPDLSGAVVMPPHYFEVEWYLKTLDYVEQLSPTTLLLTHYPPIHGAEVGKFVEESRNFVVECRQLIKTILVASRDPIDSQGIVDLLRDRLDIPGADYQYALLARAHLNHLTRQGQAIRHGDGDKCRWSIEKGVPYS